MKSANERDIQYSFTYQDAVEVLRLVRESQCCDALELEIGDIKLSLTRTAEHTGQATNGVAVKQPSEPRAAQPAVVSAPTAPAAGATVSDESLVPVRPPTLGIFYRSASPDTPPFVKEGDMVKADDQVGVLEVMKLFSPVTAGVAGRVVRILVADNVLVEHGQTLMLVQPT